ncbi:MAG: serine/threonine protein kinase [Polyangiaceae bacterium]|nr:serine/threonine protein kinase [Polyangiaceae bacterium]
MSRTAAFFEGVEDTDQPHESSAHDPIVVRRAEMRARARDASSFIGSLLDLPRLSGPDRRVAFRQVIAELARGSTDEGPSPLEGIRAEALVRAIGASLEAGLADDLDWLDAGAAGCALYQIAAALPVGAEQREIGRRVLSRLLAGKADSFAVMATQMARAGGKGLLGTSVFARVALLMELPIGLEMPDCALAFAIASRRNLAREYVVGPSTRSLPDRRLAARILERAARDALRRALMGDRSGVRIVGPAGALEPVYARLLGDREPLVWRHVAIARGLLCPFTDDGVTQIENDLSAKLSPTEWRRAAAAIGGLAASKPDVAMRVASRAMRDGLLIRDPGAVTPYLWGLARTAESEPDAARELFDLAQGARPEDVADAAVTLARELGSGAFVEHARKRALSMMGGAPRSDRTDDGATALRAELQRCLESSGAADESIGAQLDRAVRAFADEGAKAAHERGLALLETVRGTVDALLAIDEAGSGDAASSALARRTSFAVVRDLDIGMLERDALVNLLRLDNREARLKSAEQAVEGMRDRAFTWLVEREIVKVGSLPADTPHLVLHLARLKTMLHLLDGEGVVRGDEDDSAAQARFQRAARALATCLNENPPPALRRAVMATFARCLDALARAGACDISDVALVAAACLSGPRDLETLAEASMDPDTRGLLARIAAVASERSLGSLELFGEEHAKVGTARSDSLRALALKLQHALEAVGRATSLRELATSGTESDVAIALENACFGLAQVNAGARARVLDVSSDSSLVRAMGAGQTTLPRSPPRALSSLIGQAIAAGEHAAPSAVADATAATVEALPRSLGGVLEAHLGKLADLPPQVSNIPADRKEPAPAAELPAWVPARRALGAFHLERPLAAGGVGSVFVVTRVEDKNDPDAERFSLKVPDYNANAARHLSEAEFLTLFRSEASALMALPQHPNLAHFVTFDLAARPKPILVMELVEGPNLERLIDTHSLDVERVVQTMQDVADGLAAMHEVEVGHLDLKPANVVLRGGTTAVLVDFGLAGRKIRLGCGSAPYSAPEVWGHVPKDTKATPMAVDVYAFACLAFEMLTASILFDAETEVAMVSQHISHDGLPPKLRAFAQDPRFLPLAELLFAALRRDPGSRIGMADFRKEIDRVTAKLAGLPWPLRSKAA